MNATDEQFTPRQRNGRLFGRGACDTKGSVAAMLDGAMRAGARRAAAGGHGDQSSPGWWMRSTGRRVRARWWPAGCRADLAIVGEPTRLEVVTAHKGTLWLELETRGKSAHGSCPELGRNAVHAMARIVDLLQTAYAAQLRRRRHPLLGCGTVSVGAICGGTQANIVPDRCTILIDRRTLAGRDGSRSPARDLRRCCAASISKPAFVKRGLPPCLPLETDPKLPLVARFLRSVGQRRPAGVRYFCDASVLGHGGIPSVVFGPGDIAQAHTAEEWISLEALERGKRLLRRFLESFS